MLKLCGAAVLASLLALTLRRLKPEMGHVLTLSAGALLTVAVLPTLGTTVTLLTSIAEAGNVPQEYLGTLLKVGGVSLLADFSAQTCRDAGEESLAHRVELAGRITLIGLALPFMASLLQQIMSLSPS